MINKKKKLINNLIFFVLIVSFSIACYSTYKLFVLEIDQDNGFFSHLLLISILSIFFLFFLKEISNYKLKVGIIYFISIFLFTIFSLELYLSYFKKSQLQKNLISENINYDKRSKFQIYNDLKTKGLKVEFPQVPNHFINSNGISYENKMIFPLGSLSNSFTFFDNLEGFYPIIKTDKYGFNNSNQIYKKEIDILLVGGSRGEGYSVQNDYSLSNQLRSYNYNVMNLSRAHNGALSKLATISEYGNDIKPKIVLWLFYEYDLRYLFSELKSPTLLNYLEKDNFDQNLKNRQHEIDKAYKKFLKNYEYNNPYDFYEEIKNFFRFGNLRKILKIKPKYRETLKNNKPLEFKKILNKTKKIINSWGGELYFVSLPDYKRFSENYKPDSQDFVVQTVKELKIPFIDMYEYIIKNNNDPLSIFPYRIDYDYNNNYNAKGYSFVANEINNKIINDSKKFKSRLN